MGWYDFFARFYDRSLEPLYAEQRRIAAEALRLQPGHGVLDLPCGTGLSFDAIAPAVQPGGHVVGVDLSHGMLDKAQGRVRRHAWSHVTTLQCNVHELDADRIATAVGGPIEIDRLHVFLGLSAFPRWEEAFERLWELLAPSGRAVVVDVHAEQPSVQGRMVNLVARADIRRRAWEPLQRLGADFDKRDLPSRKEHGGQLFLATATKR